jgi:hypothetical protein
MIGSLFKALAYSKAPRTTFTVLHPAKAVLFRKFTWDMRHAHAPRVSALGAAALALPLGLWLGRKRARHLEEVTADIGPRAARWSAAEDMPGPVGVGQYDGSLDRTSPLV